MTSICGITDFTSFFFFSLGKRGRKIPFFSLLTNAKLSLGLGYI